MMYHVCDRICYAKACGMTTPDTCRSLYVHVPVCRTRCGYCDFYSEVLDETRAPVLVDALLAELAAWVRRVPLRLDTIYVGGGTPTVLPLRELHRLLDAARALAEPTGVEFTVEANPATVTGEVAEALVGAGVNRVSLGAQSFILDELRALDRRHAPEQVGQTVATCRHAGISQVSLDLIFGIPGQTLRSWEESLTRTLELEPEHVSCYGLTYEAGTPLAGRLELGEVERVDEDVEADMYELILDRLPAAAWGHYEISNFARPGAECRHNLRYWHNEPYLGVGPSAAGFVDEVRYKNVADTAAYVAAIEAGRSAWCEEERLPAERRARETAMLELRLMEGIDRGRFAARYGQDPVEFFAEAVARNVANGLLAVDAQAVRLTRRGVLLANRVCADFL